MEKISKTIMWFFIFGLVITAATAIAVNSLAEWCFVPAIFSGFVIVGMRSALGKTHKFEWIDLIACIVGAMLIQIFCWIA